MNPGESERQSLEQIVSEFNLYAVSGYRWMIAADFVEESGKTFLAATMRTGLLYSEIDIKSYIGSICNLRLRLGRSRGESSGYGNGDGDGDGSNFIYGNGSGNCYGDGDGYGTGGGDGYGNGDGNGHGFGNGTGDGYGSGDGSGSNYVFN